MINQLFETIKKRQQSMPEGSYTTSLFKQGEDEILKKVGEEAVEVILAAKAQGNARLVEEIADLTYHTLVLLASRGLTPGDISKELENRKQ